MTERAQKLRVSLLVILPLLATAAAIVLLWNRAVFLSDIILMLAFYFITGLGVTIGYHRMLTHRSFQASSLTRAILLILGCMAFEGAPADWAATHIKHHAHSDEEDDPHSPTHGFWHAHFGWLFSTKNFPPPEQYAPHLLADPVVAFVQRWAALWMGLSLLLPFLIGGWTGLLWGGGVRIFLLTHMTWSVNSVCHCFGRRPFETTDQSHNQWVVGFFGFGEGWHNNHHAFPQSAFHGLRWWQFDLSGVLIRTMERLHLVWNVHRVSPETQAAHRHRTQGMQETLTQLRNQLITRIESAKAEFQSFVMRRLTPPVTEPELMECIDRCERVVRRLEEIQQNVSRATHLKRQKLSAYFREVQDLIHTMQASVKMPPSMA